MSVDINKYTLGTLVTVDATFTDTDGEVQDPTNVYVNTLSPSGELTEYEYDVDDGVVRDSEGNYHLDIDANEPGTWYYYWFSTGMGQIADEGEFSVLEVHAIP